MTEVIESSLDGLAGFVSEPTDEAAPQILSKIVCAGWGLSAVGVAIIFLPFQTLFLRFMTDHLGIAAGVAGVILAIGRLSDGASDVMVGFLSDRTRSRWGRRRPYLVGGAIFAALAFMALFYPPAFTTPGGLAIYIVIGLLIFSISFTFWYVPFLAMTSEMTNDHNSRSLLVTFRVSGSTVGQLIGGAGCVWLVTLLGGARVAYGQMAVAFGLVGLSCMLTGVFVSRKVKLTNKTSIVSYTTLERFKLSIKNTPYMLLISTKIVAYFGVWSYFVSGAFFTRYVLQVSDNWLGTFLLANSVVGLLSVPFWLWLSRIMEKQTVTMISLFILAISDALWLFAGPDFPKVLAVVQYAINGACGAGLSLMAYNMLADVMEYDYLKTGLRREGAMAGIVTLIEKVSGAGGVAITGLILGAMGYVQSKLGANAHQSAGAVRGIFLCFAVIPAISAFLAAVVIWRYSLTRKALDVLRKAGPQYPQLAKGAT